MLELFLPSSGHPLLPEDTISGSAYSAMGKLGAVAAVKQCSRDAAADDHHFHCDRQCRWHLDSSTPAPMTGEIPGAFFDRCVVGTQSSGVCKCTDMRTGESLGTTPLSTNFIAIAAANII